MEHTEIRRNLSAYLDGAVSPDEKAQIEEHLASCGVCRGALADLERTVGHLKSLPDVEPPPWMTAKIMARVREAAEKKPAFWQRIFLPFQVKLPLQALALVILCVTGYYLARTNAPLLQLTVSSPANREETPALVRSIPPGQRTPQQAPVSAAPSKAPVSEPRTPSARTAAARHREVSTGYAPAPPARTPAPASHPAQRAPAQLPATYPSGSATAPESAPAAAYPSAPYSGAEAQLGRNSESLSRRYTGGASQGVTQKSAKSEGTRFPTQRYGDFAPSGAVPRGSWPERPEETGQAERLEPTEQLARPAQLEVTLEVSDPEGAVSVVEEAVTRGGGRIVRRAYGGASHLLQVRIEAAKTPKLMDRLVKIGMPRKPPQFPAEKSGMVELTIRW